MTQQHGYFFLNVDDYLSFAQPIGQPLIVLTELLILTGQRIGLRFRPRFCGVSPSTMPAARSRRHFTR